ncbi:MAG TPA: kelch repeat-containing protein [Acidimicrobiales bacterium]|nr:kelch repeat-containing protein [Acidimicrobiales bacterium]
MVLFGGTNASFSAAYSDTWVWTGTDWQQEAPLTPPPGRYGEGFAADSTSGQVLLFGGLDQGSDFLADTWSFAGQTEPTTTTSTTTSSTVAAPLASTTSTVSGPLSRASSSLAFTGTGTTLRWTAVLGICLVLLALVLFGLSGHRTFRSVGRCQPPPWKE